MTSDVLAAYCVLTVVNFLALKGESYIIFFWTVYTFLLYAKFPQNITPWGIMEWKYAE